MYESLTDSPMNKKLCFCLCMALLAAFVMPEKLRAQRPDFTTWLNVGAEYELKKSGFTLESGLEWRTKDHFRQTDRVGWNVDGSYQLLSWLKVGMGYELHLRNLDEEEWGFRHRYKLQAILSARVWSRLKVSLREKFQHTLDGDEENELRLRTRLKLAYDVGLRRAPQRPGALRLGGDVQRSGPRRTFRRDPYALSRRIGVPRHRPLGGRAVLYLPGRAGQVEARPGSGVRL